MLLNRRREESQLARNQVLVMKLMKVIIKWPTGHDIKTIWARPTSFIIRRGSGDQEFIGTPQS